MGSSFFVPSPLLDHLETAWDPGLVAADDQRLGDVAFADLSVEGPAADEAELVFPVGGKAEIEGVKEGQRAEGAGGEDKRGDRGERVVFDPPGEQKCLSV